MTQKNPQNTRRKLHRAKERAEQEAKAQETGPFRLSRKWVEHGREMEKMLKGIDLERGGYD